MAYNSRSQKQIRLWKLLGLQSFLYYHPSNNEGKKDTPSSRLILLMALLHRRSQQSHRHPHDADTDEHDKDHINVTPSIDLITSSRHRNAQ